MVVLLFSLKLVAPADQVVPVALDFQLEKEYDTVSVTVLELPVYIPPFPLNDTVYPLAVLLFLLILPLRVRF